jgi:hypothetical protein
MKMRKSFIIALGLASVGALTQSAFAARNCSQESSDCWTKMGDAGYQVEVKANVCSSRAAMCRRENEQQGYNYSGEKIVTGGGGSSRPKPGTYRTADGGTLMVTPEGKEWVWNGKYNEVVTTNTGYPVVINVKQGDPDVMLKKWADGRQYNVADPAYGAAVAREEAKKAAAAAAQKATAQQTARQQTRDYLAGTRGGSSKPNAQGAAAPVQANNVLQTGVKPRHEK